MLSCSRGQDLEEKGDCLGLKAHLSLEARPKGVPVSSKGAAWWRREPEGWGEGSRQAKEVLAVRLWSLHLPELPAACLLNGDNDDICLRNNARTIPTLPCRHTGALTEWQGSSLPLHHVHSQHGIRRLGGGCHIHCVSAGPPRHYGF